MALSDQQLERYARHILMPEIGGAGQQKLMNAKVLVIGAGGLGSPVLMYLAAAGIGTIGIVDDDSVDLSNLQRQIIHATDDIGRAKAVSAKETIAGLNPDVDVVVYEERFSAGNSARIIADFDLVVDGSDNFTTRFLVNDSCYLAGKTLVSAAINRFDAQLSTYKAHLGNEYPCYRCIFPEAPPPGTVPTCAEAGVMGALCGTLGSLQANEVIKEITGAGTSLAGQLLIVDGLDTTFRKVKVRPDPKCALCSDQATITDLSAHAA
ncbi:MAG: molybdopterin-synthase adenylyltransferase MoeB [Proteobacteria bacterium]|nr:molybdopterin-synthase adenylyltransferase MoeB [Pseudomonadota bacterium]